MAIPVALQSIKASGIYRIIYDKSTVLNEDTNILRLVVGYSEKGPFNTPVYVRSVDEFVTMFGNGSKKLEKRGVYFHKIAKQCLQAYPILVLNLKKFANEYVSGVAIDTNTQIGSTLKGSKQINLTKFFVGDIYDTTRFWELDASKLHEADTTEDGKTYNKADSNKKSYINISSVGAIKDSNTIFIRKAAGSKVSSYNVTVSDWYNDGTEEIPEYLQDKLDSEISDYFAEIYVFKGQFTKKQIIASETLQSYFDVITTTNDDGVTTDVIKLKPYVLNAYGEKIDTLDALYEDSASGAFNHYVGSLIPYFKNKLGAYVDLSVLFNQDVDSHNMMMSFNTDLLEETDNSEPVNIDLSCSNNASESYKAYNDGHTSVLGNVGSPVNIVTYSVGPDERTQQSIIKTEDSYKDEVYGSSFSNIPINGNVKPCGAEKYKGYQAVAVDKTIGGAIVARDRFLPSGCEGEVSTASKLSFPSVQSVVDINTAEDEYGVDVSGLGLVADRDSKWSLVKDDKVYKYESDIYKANTVTLQNGEHFYILKSKAVATKVAKTTGVKLTVTDFGTEYDAKNYQVVKVKDANEASPAGNYEVCASNFKNAVKITGHKYNFYVKRDGNAVVDGSHTQYSFDSKVAPQSGQIVTLQEGEVYAAQNETYGLFKIDELIKSDVEKAQTVPSDDYVELENVTVYDVDKVSDIYSLDKDATHPNKVVAYFENGKQSDGNADSVLFVIFDGTPYTVDNEGETYIVRMEHSCNQEIGDLRPYYLEGYTYENDKPSGTSMKAKLDWQNFQLSALTEYKGVRTALLNKSEIDYRYIVDTFESFVDSELKSVLSFLTKEKDSALFIGNLPSVKTFLKCPFNSYTDAKGNFNVQYVVDGYNKKKSHTIKFSLPSEPNGASYAAFYTPLKFSDGYIDEIIPSAGLVSNLFVQKYYTRHPYDIIAGPNYGSIVMSGLTGPDYNYSKEELNIIEPFGFNCMVYRPNFGTFINANQTAKQTPKSALSSINVRELCIYIQDEIEKLLQSYQWEFNNAVVRQKIKDKADSICQNVMNNGGIQDYLNIMDESNNTPEIIDNEMSVLSTHIEPGRGMGKMVQELTLYRTGQMRATISES